MALWLRSPILIGNLTRDAEPVTGARSPVTRMRIATNRVWRDADGNRQESAEFHSVVAFGRIAEICADYCHKGRRVYIDGRLRTREYDGSDGLRRTSTEIVVDDIRLLDRPPSSVPDELSGEAGAEPEEQALTAAARA